MHNIDKAIELIKNHEIVGIPTETVYGLAGSIYSDIAINKIFTTKERPFFDPLIVHINSTNMAKELCIGWNEICDTLSQNFWPGPLTIVMKKNKNVSDLITSGLDSVGLRIPNHPITLELIEKSQTPLAAPSANKFKCVSPTSRQHVIDEFGDAVFVLDGGECEIGIESTVVSVIENRVEIYRPGMITKEMIDEALSEFDIQSVYQSSPVAPGQLEHHYMPKIPIILLWEQEITVIDNKKFDISNPYIWSLIEEPSHIARNLYAKFRIAQDENFSCIIIKLKKEMKENTNFKGIINRLSKAKSAQFGLTN